VPVAPQQQAYHDEQTDERECRREVFRADAVEPVEHHVQLPGGDGRCFQVEALERAGQRREIVSADVLQARRALGRGRTRELPWSRLTGISAAETAASRAALLTLSRLANYGLMLISPIILVRLLTVADFGRYREFLLYATLLQSFAVFSINDSLLYCIPAQPHSPWRTVRQTAVLIACASLCVVIALAAADGAMSGRLVGRYLTPLVAYTLLSVNLDFWEYLWLAQGRPGRFAGRGGRGEEELAGPLAR